MDSLSSVELSYHNYALVYVAMKKIENNYLLIG